MTEGGIQDFPLMLYLLPLSGKHVGKGSKKAWILQDACLEMCCEDFDTVAKKKLQWVFVHSFLW